MNDLILHGFGQASTGGGSGQVPIEGLTPIITSDKLKGIGLKFANRSLGSLTDRRGVNHYNGGKVYVLHSSGVTIYDAVSGEVIAENYHVTSSSHMTPDTAATDGSYYLTQGSKLYKYNIDGTLVWEATTGSSFTCITVDASGVYVGNTSSSNYYVYKYNRVNGQSIWSSGNISYRVIDVAVTSNAVIVSTESYRIYRLNPSNGSQIYVYTLPNSDNAYALAIEANTNHFYSIIYNRTLRKHSFQTGEPIFTLNNTNVTTVYNLFVDGGNNVYTISNREITKLDNQLTGFIWRENHDITDNPINGYGFDKEKGNIYILRTHTAKILTTEKEWSPFIPHQFEGAVNSIDIDKSGNFYGASDDWTVRKFNAAGKEEWIYRHNRMLNFIKADKDGNVFIADSSRVFKKLNPLGVEQWSLSISGVSGDVKDLVINSEGVIILSISYWHSSSSSRKDYLVKVSSDGKFISRKEIGNSGVFNSLHLWDDKTILAVDRLYDIESLRCVEFFNSANPIFNLQGDFLYGLNSSNIKILNKYSGGQVYSTNISNVDYTNFYLKVAQGLDGAIYIADSKKTLVKLNNKGEELWRYQTRDNITDVKVDEDHNIYLATGYYIEKLTQTFGIESYENR